MLKIVFVTGALGFAVFAGLLHFYENQAAGSSRAPGSTYCEMVDIWLADGRAGVPKAERFGWPPEGVPGRVYSRDCGGAQ